VGTSFAKIAENDGSRIILSDLREVEYSVAPRLLWNEDLSFWRRSYGVALFRRTSELVASFP
jgi:hypothetical protein